MKVSYSKVSKYDQCPFLYKLLYIDKLKAAFDGKADNALHLGTCLHEGIEHRDIEHAIEIYKKKYPEITVDNEIEMAKLRAILPVAISQLPEGEYEYTLSVPEEFIGYIDMLVKVEDGVYDLYDFKYANSAERYMSSAQVHLYKYYYEKLTGNRIRNMYYAVIPKCKDTLKDLEYDKLMKRITGSYSKKDVQLVPITYDQSKVDQFMAKKQALEAATEFPKVYNSRCQWCQFQRYCRTNGKDTSELEQPEESKEFLENSLF